MTRIQARRGGFTLTELLVSLALIVFIMSIMAQAFGAASKVVTDLRAANELAERLRGITTLLRDDLSENQAPAHVRTGGQSLLSNGEWPPEPAADGSSDHQGFFRIWQVGTPTQVALGADTAYLMSGSSLHFTRFLRGSFPTETFSTLLPRGVAPRPLFHPLVTYGSTQQRENRFQSIYDPADAFRGATDPVIYRSRVAEVAWWLAPTGEVTSEDPNGAVTTALPIYVLCRRQRLVVEGRNEVKMPWVDMTDPQFREVSMPTLTQIAPAATEFNADNTVSLTIPSLRFGGRAISADYIPPNYPAATPPPSLSPTDPNPGIQQLLAGLPPDVTKPFPFTPGNPNDVADIVMNDVLSMDVRVMVEGSNEFVDLSHPYVQFFNSGNPFYPATFAAGQTPYYTFDTWTSQQYGRFDYKADDGTGIPRWKRPGTNTCVPVYKHRNAMTGQLEGPVIKIKAIMVTIRIWDSKSQFTRQVSMIQDM